MTPIEDKLLELRREWKENPTKRPIIEARAKLLKTVLEVGTIPYVPWYHKNEEKPLTVDETMKALI